MDRFPPAEDGPRFEMASIGRSLSDLTPDDGEVPEVGRTEALVWTGIALFSLIAFVGWLLVG
jgi:hypothetical protein